MLDAEEYSYFTKELLKRKTRPYTMSNRDLAGEYFTRFKKEYPTSSIHYYDIHQYICLDDRARRYLVKLVKGLVQEKESEIQELNNLTTDIERSFTK